MARPPRLYTRLTRPATSVGSYKTLWYASDHLIVVTSTGFSEEYLRIRFADIKAFFLTPSDRRLGWGIAWWTGASLSGITGVTLYLEHGGGVPAGVICGLFLLLAAWNHLLGPSCKAYFVTGVQTARLPSLVRRRKARKLLAILHPLILAAQPQSAEPPPLEPGPLPT